ncbi:MAG TPA: protein-glutamate O-methyltransferase [Dongiaceae bacterium]|nr:protein-glutamate O-methyltransferase [Dongiaceae bacterium]
MSSGLHPPRTNAGGLDFSSREFPMTAEDFRFIQRLARERTGIELGEHKREMIYSRIVRRIRTLDLMTFRDYCQYLQQNTDSELTPFINAITTNLTAFFREPHHFDFLSRTALPEIRRRNAASHRIRIWSAGCSTGEEPYSIAITLQRSLGSEPWDARILATDLDTNVLDHGRAGIYGGDRMADLDKDILNQYFTLTKGKNRHDDRYQVKDALRELIRFNQLNLLEQWPMRGPFDVIFCRNVVIYFSKETQRTLFDRYADILAPNGYLCIGHSESLHGVSKRFEAVGRTLYRRIQ